MRKSILTAALLSLILVYGGWLRLVGQNWDDFSHIHPDERFLTLFVLPQVGGGNSFTADHDRFPEQQILILGGSATAQTLDDIRASTDGMIGVIRGTVAVETASWLGFEKRARIYEDYSAAQVALLSRDVAALIVHSAQPWPEQSGVAIAGTISSTELQQLRCEAHYPETGGIGGYFDARCSPLNPHNAGHGFYVYGTFPLLLAHFSSEIVRQATAAGLPYFDFQAGHLVWRGMSMVFDMLTILLVFALGARLQNRWVGLLAALFYAAAPLAIQKAHFGTMNAVTSFLVTLALYYAARVQQRGKLASYLMFGIAFGLAMASRINVAPLAGVIVLAALLRAMPVFEAGTCRRERRQELMWHCLGLILAGFGAILAFRLFNPYAFEGPGLFGIVPNHRWIANLAEVSSGVAGARDYPPAWQWVARSPLVHSFKDMVFWGMGLSFGVLGWLGSCLCAYRILRNHNGALANVIPLAWIFGYYLFISRVWAIVPRYYLPLYGALAVMAGWCLYEVWRQRSTGPGLRFATLPTALCGGLLLAVGCAQVFSGISDATAVTALFSGAVLLGSVTVTPLRRWQPAILTVFALAFSLLWGLMFGNIYRHQTTLVQATRYIQERVPADFAMEIEGADETVPLINVAIHNTGVALPGFTGSPYNRANHYYEAAPVSVSFTAPANGTVHQVYAPHLGDPLDDPQPEELRIQVLRAISGELLAEAQLRANLHREEHPLGSDYTLTFDQPFEAIAGEDYTFVVEAVAGSGDIIGSGSVVLTEGTWDNHVTGINICSLPDGLSLADDPPSGLVSAADCNGTQVHYAHVNSQDQIMSYPLDNQIKYDDILRTLDMGDYLTIASNRFYDAEARIPMRWPLTNLYYRKLFAGALGYELAAVYEETFELGPWRVSDQHLPTFSSPGWLNALEADESFHVYDHPAAFIFRKTDDYSRARVAAILSQASLLQAHELQESEDEAQLLGVINWSVAEAGSVPTALTFPPAEYHMQTQGGAWSDRFFSDAVVNTNQAAGVAVWYVTIFLFGLLAFPLVYSLLPKMSDGGYCVSKLVGMLVVAWLAWAISALKIPIWSQAGIVFSLALLAMLSFGIGYRNRSAFGAYLRRHWRRLAWLEVIAFAAFMVMIGVRLTNPDLWHPAKGGEKPMDFAYLNGVLRSTVFPPIDPWFAGGFINYYYFGYVLLGAPTLLLGLVPAFAYNLMIPTLFSLTGMGAFSAAFNIFSRLRQPEARYKEHNRQWGNPWLAGAMALILCVGLGNLDTIRVLGNGLAQLGGHTTPLGLEHFLVEEYGAQHDVLVSSEIRAELASRAADAHIGDRLRYEFNISVSLWRGILNGIASVLQGEEPRIGSDRWYWGPSRVLAETPGVQGGAITEMPYFTFLYGDLHAHMISMPLVLLTVVLLFNELNSVGRDRRNRLERALAIALLALSVGVLRATNTWDWPSMTLLAVVALAYGWWLRWKGTVRPIHEVRYAIGAPAVCLGGAVLLTLPMQTTLATAQSFQPIGAGLELLRLLFLLLAGGLLLQILVRFVFVRASALDLAAKVGGFLLLNLAVALPYTSWYAATYNSVRLWDGGKTPLWAYFDIHGLFLFLVVSLLVWISARWLRVTRVRSLLKYALPFKAAVGAVLATGAGAVALTLAGYQVALIVLPLLLWLALLFLVAELSRALRFTLVLIGLALAMTLGVEIVVIGGDIGRQNTVFKFYMQVWLLLSVAGGVAFACIARASQAFTGRLKALWYASCAALIFVAALFPIMGTRARSLDRMAPGLPLTLNGMDYMTQAMHYESSPINGTGAFIDLSVDHKLIRWLQENVPGSPVIIEGRRRPSEYQWNGRIAITTGLPSVLGWNFHQRQQRTFYPLPRWVEQRERNIQQFYTTPNVDIAVDIIHHFSIQYIIRSGLEEVHGTVEGLRKFEEMVVMGLLSVAYEVDGGKIYQVEADALLNYLTERAA